MYLGIRANPVLGATQESAIEVREGAAPLGINRRFALHLLYYGWQVIAQMQNGNGVFAPDTDLAGDIAHQRVPVIAWNCDDGFMNSDRLIAGGNAPEDAVITATAKVLKQYPGPILLRWSWEFNVYGKNQNCRSIDPSVGPTQQVYADFIAAWQHIRTLFQAAGASNVSFVWNPGHWNADGDPKDPHAFYPGNAFVDWVAIDTYQRAANGTFSDDFDLFYNDFSQPQYGKKPMLVGENGAMGFSEHMAELQATYLQGLLAALKANKYPLLKGYCYFDSNGTLGNWVLDDNGGKGQGGLAAFAALAASPPFAPAISLVANAEGENPVIAPNAWVEIKGSNLAPAGVSRIWRATDFVNGQLPTQLDGVSVTVGGKPAYVYYISPTQVNVLTAPDNISGPVPVVVNNNGAVTAAATVQAQALSPSFFVFDGVHVAAVHANGDLLGPTALYPGYTTPAKPGETVLLYANGFGSTSTMQGGLSPLPLVRIGGVAASVQFAGLVAPGQFQFNVVVPASLADGEQAITATYGGLSTQSGAVLAVAH